MEIHSKENYQNGSLVASTGWCFWLLFFFFGEGKLMQSFQQTDTNHFLANGSPAINATFLPESNQRMLSWWCMLVVYHPRKLWKRWSLEQWSVHPGWLFCKGDFSTQLYGNCYNRLKDPYKPPGTMECHVCVLNIAHLGMSVGSTTNLNHQLTEFQSEKCSNLHPNKKLGPNSCSWSESERETSGFLKCEIHYGIPIVSDVSHNDHFMCIFEIQSCI